MKNIGAKLLLVLLIVVATAELYSEFFHMKELMFFTKPLTLPLLAIYFWLKTEGNTGIIKKLMLGAFLFSWFGDISLMLTPETAADTELMGIPKNKYFFLAGLGSFLVAQLLFIFSYRNAVWSSVSKVKLIWLVPFLVYWVGILLVIIPPLQANPEKNTAVIPVIIYAGVLISMAATAMMRYGRTNSKSFLLTLLGACIFVVSDTLIAINFLAMKTPMAQAGFLIFSTYIVAEFMIAQGILEHLKAKSD